MAKFSFNNSHNEFFTELKSEVDTYFKTTQQKKTGDWRLFSKSLILMPFALGCYLLILFYPMPTWGLMVISGLLGLACASIGFNVMHDACHGSYSTKKWVNNIMGLTLNCMGGTAFIWKQKHNVIHHTYTNVDGVDDDIAKSPVIRQCYSQKWVPAHRYQHLYLPFVYSITSFAWTFIMDFTKYFTQKVYTTPLQNMDAKEHVLFWFSKAMNVLFYILIPIVVIGWSKFFIYYLTMHIILGFLLAIVFQLAHVVEETEFVFAPEDHPTKVENSWAEHQVKTTANFATDNAVINWYVGGLNFQVEHHLFPRVSHVHYKALSPIVERICKKYNLPYNNHPTMWSSVKSHWKFMKELGQNPVNPNESKENIAMA